MPTNRHRSGFDDTRTPTSLGERVRLGRFGTRIGMSERVWLAALRGLWASYPWSVGQLLRAGMEDTSGAFATTAGAFAWGAWALGLAALLTPHTVSLTAIRILAPTALAASCWAAAVEATGAGAGSGATGRAAVALAVCAAGAVGVMSPLVGARFIDATSYGDERRLALRAPFGVLAGVLVPTWALTVSGPAAGPLLWASGHRLLGPLLTVAGLVVAVAGVRALHSLARRWLVFVPAGLVLHDRLALAEPTLFRRATIASFGPAPANPAAHVPTVDAGGARDLRAGNADAALDLTTGSAVAKDLTAGALGLVFELRFREPVTITPARSRREPQQVEAMLLTPTRPAAVLQESQRRRIPTEAA